MTRISRCARGLMPTWRRMKACSRSRFRASERSGFRIGVGKNLEVRCGCAIPAGGFARARAGRQKRQNRAHPRRPHATSLLRYEVGVMLPGMRFQRRDRVQEHPAHDAHQVDRGREVEGQVPVVVGPEQNEADDLRRRSRRRCCPSCSSCRRASRRACRRHPCRPPRRRASPDRWRNWPGRWPASPSEDRSCGWKAPGTCWRR